MNNAKTIAHTIRQQLGRSFGMMTGAKNHVYGETDGNAWLEFAIGRGAKCGGKTVNRVRITYVAGRDTYDVRFGYVRKYDFTVRTTVEDVYADQLCPVFEANTGMYTRL